MRGDDDFWQYGPALRPAPATSSYRPWCILRGGLRAVCRPQVRNVRFRWRIVPLLCDRQEREFTDGRAPPNLARHALHTPHHRRPPTPRKEWAVSATLASANLSPPLRPLV